MGFQGRRLSAGRSSSWSPRFDVQDSERPVELGPSLRSADSDSEVERSSQRCQRRPVDGTARLSLGRSEGENRKTTVGAVDFRVLVILSSGVAGRAISPVVCYPDQVSPNAVKVVFALLLGACSAPRQNAEQPRPVSTHEVPPDAGANPMDDMSWLDPEGRGSSERPFLQLSTDELRGDLARQRGIRADKIAYLRAYPLQNVKGVDGLVLALHRWGNQPLELRGWLVTYSPCAKASRPCPSSPTNLGPALTLRALTVLDLRAELTKVDTRDAARRAPTLPTKSVEWPVLVLRTEHRRDDGGRIATIRLVSLQRASENATMLILHDAEEVVSLQLESPEGGAPELTVSREPRPCDRCAPRPREDRLRLAGERFIPVPRRH